MSNTLEDLKAGRLKGAKRLQIACGLKAFPEEIITLSDTLEVLDLSGNDLNELPESIAKLKKLKIIFFANNNFTTFPKILASCPTLSMIGFKSNKITSVPENAFPPLLRWLILTDNQIKVLPKSIGKVSLLQKCALAGNLIEALPESMKNCENLALLRISANKLRVIPNWLFSLPKLSWVAFAGNPGSDSLKLNSDLRSVDWQDFHIQQILGEGASGLISKAKWISESKDVAIKVFKGDVTSDGLPDDEMAISILAGFHENLVSFFGKIQQHPEGKNGLIMELIPPSFINLGNPPNFDTCTRDTFEDNALFTEEEFLKIVKSIASVTAQLHSKGINHGDLYAHNILVNKSADCLLGDYGAASYYDTNSELAHNIERIEVSAFGCLIEDLLGLVSKDELNKNVLNRWKQLITSCFNPDVKSRMSFNEIVAILNQF